MPGLKGDVACLTAVVLFLCFDAIALVLFSCISPVPGISNHNESAQCIKKQQIVSRLSVFVARRWVCRSANVIGQGVHCSLGRRGTAPLGAPKTGADWAGVGTTGRGNFARTGQARPNRLDKNKATRHATHSFSPARLNHGFTSCKVSACLLTCQPLPPIPAGHAIRLTFDQLLTASLPTAPHSLLAHRQPWSGSLGRAAPQSLLFDHAQSSAFVFLARSRSLSLFFISLAACFRSLFNN